MHKSKLLARASLLRIVFFFTNVVVAFLLMPFVIRSLGDTLYGLWIVVGSLMGYYWLVDFGISAAVERHISQAIGRKRYGDINIIASTGFFIYSLCGLAILALSIPMAYLLPHFLQSISEPEIFKQVIIILGISFAFNFPMRIFSGVLSANLRFDLITCTNFFILIIRTSLIFYFLKQGGGILALANITLFVDIINRLIFFVMVKKMYPNLMISRTFFRKKKVKELVNYGGFAFISQLAGQIQFNLDNLVIMIFLGLSPVTMYSIASRLTTYFRKFMTTALGMLIPLFSQYEGEGNYDAIREKFIFVTKINGYLAIFIGSCLVIFGQVFIQRWMGPEYRFSYNILVVLGVPITFGLMQRAIFELLRGISKHKFYAYVDIAEAISNLVLSIIFVRIFGLIGVAIGTAIPIIISQIFILPRYTCLQINMSVRQYYVECFFGVLFRAGLIILPLFALYQRWITPDYLRIFLLVLLQTVVYFSILFFIGFKENENRMMRNLLQSIHLLKK